MTQKKPVDLDLHCYNKLYDRPDHYFLVICVRIWLVQALLTLFIVKYLKKRALLGQRTITHAGSLIYCFHMG